MDKEAVAQLVQAMTDFSANTKNDAASVAVARVTNRLAHQGSSFEPPLTRSEMRIVNLFINNQKAA